MRQVCNAGALRLYQKLGFIRDKRLHRYYLSGSGGCRCCWVAGWIGAGPGMHKVCHCAAGWAAPLLVPLAPCTLKPSVDHLSFPACLPSTTDAYRLKLLLPGGTARRRAELEAAQELEALGLGEEEQQGQQAQQQQQPPKGHLEQQQQQQRGQEQRQQDEAAGQLEAEEALAHMQQHGEHDHQAAS